MDWKKVSEGLPFYFPRVMVYGEWDEYYKSGKNKGKLKGHYTIFRMAKIVDCDFYVSSYIGDSIEIMPDSMFRLRDIAHITHWCAIKKPKKEEE